ncbi:NtrZ family periplasmic regulatory protein [Phenylobacterium sp.]|uniref:NtrZ family periplasmic regulatory protein n=1 Tax=Phenylobacterium sp. TaxID=1871053 RepID=UPI00286BE745|nr:hypothetical protein [Phenylobacterium sp.]
MSVRRFARLIASTALVGAAGFLASGGAVLAADARGKSIDFTVRTDTSAIAPLSQSLKWDAAKGRWGVTLDLRQTSTRETNLNDIQAGAYYRITPSLRVGGAVAFGDQQVPSGLRATTPDGGAPRVQLETKFKF